MKRGSDGKLIFSPSDLVTFFKSPYISWLAHYNTTVEKKDRVEREEDASTKLLSRKGDEFEREQFAKIKSNKSVVEIDKTQPYSVTVPQTIQAMKDGVDIIYQAAFQLGDFAGYSDFVQKVPGKSKFGDYSYEIFDTKLSQKAKPEYAVQLLAYSEMLAEILGSWPERWHLILGTGEVQSLRVSDFRYYYSYFKKSFEKFHAEFDPKKPPVPEPWEEVAGYEDHIQSKFKAMDHICLVAGMSRSQIKKFNKNQIMTRHQLADAPDKARPQGMQQAVFERLREQVRLQLETEKSGKLQFKILEHDEDDHRGLARLPDPDEGDVMFDMEGDPFSEGGLEYLFGVYYKEKGRWTFRDWHAPDPADEKAAFTGFVEWVIERQKKYPRMHIYHYANYEKAALQNLSNKHSCCVAMVDHILRAQLLVDLYCVVKEGVRVGSESYSIKKLEPLYDFKRASEVATAGDSVVEFNRYQDLRLADPRAAQKIFDEIVEYNKEDVISTLGLLEWLRERKTEQDIEYVPAEIEERDSTPAPWETISNRLIDQPPKWIKTDEQRRVNKLIAGLSGFFHREDRPVYWRFFHCDNLDADELYGEPDCIAQAEVYKVSPKGIHIKFDPTQPLKMKVGDDFSLWGTKDPFSVIKVLALDLVRGEALVSPSKKYEMEVGSEISLIPTSPLRTETQKTRLQDLAEAWSTDGEKAVPKAALNLLYRRPPNVKGVIVGDELYAEGEKALDAAVRAALALQESTLSIQGPPGTGKTYTGATIICALMKAGKRVAVVSQGKKTVENLLAKVVERWSELGYPGKCPAILMADNNKGGAAPLKHCTYVPNAKVREKYRSYSLVGGTHWVFSHPDLEGAFDYLFFDEAGQFSLAAAVACSFSARNLILLGDQMQLEQVNVGTHPDSSGQSVLAYYMNGQSTIPRTHGVFLDETWRMHPSICALISELVYEGRLKANDRTSSHVLSHAQGVGLPNAGVFFVPVDHEGNSTRSEEEADRLVLLLADLMKSSVPHDNSIRFFKGGIEDLIVVTPYNAQVELLRSKLPAGTKVGSVDLFQGQEAWVSVLSMCASGEEGLHRGIEFLLSKNRMNVGLSRAKAISIVVGSVSILKIRPRSLFSFQLLNLYSALIRK